MANHDEPAERRSTEARVSFGWIEALSLTTSDVGAALRSSVYPGAAHERHRRSWRMGQHSEHDGVLVGRLGFETESATEVWNDEKKDFEEKELARGTTSPFAIRLRDLRLAFQLRPPAIDAKAFVGALQGLLNGVDDRYRWRVHRDTQEIAFGEWKSTIDRITSIDATLRRPNPHYADREIIENAMEGGNLDTIVVQMLARKKSNEGIDLQDEFVREVVEHSQAYGKLAARAEVQVDGKTVESKWRSGDDTSPEVLLPANAETHEVDLTRLEKEIRNRPAASH